MNKRILIIYSCTILLLAGALQTGALAQADVRAMGMGGAWTAMSRGMEAVDWNPANLSLSKPHHFYLGANAAMGLQTNSFALDMYNTYSGEFITEQDKLDILAEIPEEGMVMDVGTNLSAFGLSIGPFALTVQGVAHMKGTLDKDFFNLVMLGNEIDQEFSFDDTEAAGSAYTSYTLTYALPIYTSLEYRLSGGVNYRFLSGYYNMDVEPASGGLVTRTDGFYGNAEASVVTAEGGTGHALDFGLALEAPRGWTFGFALNSLTSNMTWDDETERHVYTVSFDSISVATDDIEDAIADTDTTYAIDSYETKLPKVMRIGASNSWRSLRYAIDIEKGFDDLPGSADKMGLNLGAEWKLTGWFRPRVGMGFGGKYSGHSSFGLGMHVGPLYLDFAVENRGRVMPGDTKGLAAGFGLTMRI